MRLPNPPGPSSPSQSKTHGGGAQGNTQWDEPPTCYLHHEPATSRPVWIDGAVRRSLETAHPPHLTLAETCSIFLHTNNESQGHREGLHRCYFWCGGGVVPRRSVPWFSPKIKRHCICHVLLPCTYFFMAVHTLEARMCQRLGRSARQSLARAPATTVGMAEAGGRCGGGARRHVGPRHCWARARHWTAGGKQTMDGYVYSQRVPLSGVSKAQAQASRQACALIIHSRSSPVSALGRHAPDTQAPWCQQQPPRRPPP